MLFEILLISAWNLLKFVLAAIQNALVVSVHSLGRLGIQQKLVLGIIIWLGTVEPLLFEPRLTGTSIKNDPPSPYLRLQTCCNSVVVFDIQMVGVRLWLTVYC